MSEPARRPIPLRRRRLDMVILGFFAINFVFITYIVDVEQLTIADPNNFEPPLWPPAIFVELIHWWGRTFDPLLLARPVWWRMTIWIDSLYFGPFYAAALYAFAKGKEWIRFPAFLWSGLMLANVIIILGEEMHGPHATPEPGMVLLANLPWLTFPLLVLYRLWRDDPHPFTEV